MSPEEIQALNYQLKEVAKELKRLADHVERQNGRLELQESRVRGLEDDRVARDAVVAAGQKTFAIMLSMAGVLAGAVGAATGLLVGSF